ncbi:MAG TPA: hypothetical protein VFH51_07760, partial [Myxococcota bacterium]|nr:hypothetical protein [Myxococcota bacterium]
MVALSQALARSGSTVQDAETLQKLAQDVRSSDGYTKSPEDRASIEKCIHWGAKALLSPVGPSAIEVQQRKAQHKAMKAHLQTLLGPVPSTSDAPPDQQEGPLVGSGMGALALAEKPRPESPHTIAELRARGCTVEPVEWRVVCPKAADTNVRIVVQEASTNAVVWKYFEVPLTILRGFLERALKPKGMLEDQNREVVLHAPCLDVGSLTPIMEALADRSCTQLPDAPSALLKIYEAIHFLLLEEERGVRRLAVTCEQRIVESVESN